MFGLAISNIRKLTPEISAFTLLPPSGFTLPRFSAGAHLDIVVTVANNQQEARGYFLVNSSEQTRQFEIAVQLERDAGGGSAFLHSRVVGDVLQASGPINKFALAVGARRSILIAGGIGIAPILAMARELAARGSNFEAHYSARVPEDMAYRDELAEVVGQRAKLYFDADCGIDVALLLASPSADTHAFVCGPAPMIHAALHAARSQGWSRTNIHFGALRPGVPAESAFEVQIGRDGECIEVGADESIIDALLDAGYDPLFDCKRGECGMCAIGVIAGEPDHRDGNLSEAEKASGKIMCICVSRAHGERLVLDL